MLESAGLARHGLWRVYGVTMWVVEIDDRETDGRVGAALAAMPGVDVRRTRLPVGDFRVGGGLVVERKSALDFLASLKDGRLFRQAFRMSGIEEPAILILEGSGRELMSTGMRRESIQGTLITLGLIYRIPVLRSLDPEETARLMIYAASQWRRMEMGLGRGPKFKARGKRRAQMRVLKGLPGVGPVRARALLDSFGSIAALVNADASRLADVDGIGQRTAEAIRGVLEEAPPRYGVGEALDAGRQVVSPDLRVAECIRRWTPICADWDKGPW
jgi:ERCC4-type nuclease